MPIDALTALPAVQPSAPTAAALPVPTAVPTAVPAPGTETVPGAAFGTELAGQVDALQALQGERDALSLRAVTGDLQDIHEATLAATQASTTMDLMVALRNTGLQAFNELMRIQA